MKFETNRLIIRNLQLSDIVSFHKMHSNPNVMKYTGDNIKTLKEDEADLDRLIRSYSDKANDFWVWAIVKKADKQFIGTCAIINDDDRLYNAAKYEIGFRFDEDYWGNGFASELTPALIEFAFTDFGKTELMAEVDELNIASVKVIEKNMTYLKTHYNPKYQSNDRIYLIQKK